MYENFQKIDGTHPWREVCPDGYVDYPVRYRKGGKVVYFNFDLAGEMGLIPSSHPRRLNPQMEKAILKTFSLQIINEYERQQYKTGLPADALPERYMATRYLQSQHKNKRGKTSGDGRSIWNGFVRTRKMTFDLSSRGTGVTILSPGAQEAGKPLPTGEYRFGYASGLADLDEMLSSAVMSEIFYREGIPTERCLAVIEFRGKTAIGVRSSPNLIRPAHIFRYLKMGDREGLKNSFDYFLQRQEANGSLQLPSQNPGRYAQALTYIAQTYARLAAVMEEEYIFNWLAWDGDNMLADGALLDYGSIRQFAAKHNKYRYEDVDRFSTSLTEQKGEARRIVQTFAQAVDFILRKEKRKLPLFDNDPILKVFDKSFNRERQKRLLWRIGFQPVQIENLVTHHQNKIEAFREALNYFEDMKVSKGESRVPDGVDHPPVFLVRHILRELPLYISRNYARPASAGIPRLEDGKWPLMPAEEFCRIMAASYVNRKDLSLTDHRRRKAVLFQQRYRDLLLAAGLSEKKTVQDVAKRSLVINYVYRSTGDGLTWIIQKSLAAKRTMTRPHLQETVDRFIESQVLIPGKWRPLKSEELRGSSPKSRHLRRIQQTLKLYNELI